MRDEQPPPLPTDLQHLIENRIETHDGRNVAATAHAAGLDQLALEDRRVSAERRKQPDRRKRARRDR